MGDDISRLFFFKTGIHAILYDRMLPRFIHKGIYEKPAASQVADFR
jgi:hypothetical protein